VAQNACHGHLAVVGNVAVQFSDIDRNGSCEIDCAVANGCDCAGANGCDRAADCRDGSDFSCDFGFAGGSCCGAGFDCGADGSDCVAFDGSCYCCCYCWAFDLVRRDCDSEVYSQVVQPLALQTPALASTQVLVPVQPLVVWLVLAPRAPSPVDEGPVLAVPTAASCPRIPVALLPRLLPASPG